MDIKKTNLTYNTVAFKGRRTQKSDEQTSKKTDIKAPTKFDYENMNLEGIDSESLQILNKKLGVETAKQSYKQIAEENNISVNTARRKIKKTVAKIKIDNNDLTPEITEFITEFKKAFDCTKISDKKILSLLGQCPDLCAMSMKRIKNNIETVVKAFEKEGLKENDYVKTAFKKPNLFYQKPETIVNNINKTVEIFKDEGLEKSAYLKAALAQPNLFYESPNTVANRIKDTVKIFEEQGLTVSKYIDAALKTPSLFSISPKTAENSIKGTVKIFEKEGLTIEDYVKSALRSTTLFTMSPETVESHIKTIAKKYKNEGLTTEKYIKTAVKQPCLFAQSPETIDKHIKLYKYLFENKLYDEKSEAESKSEILDMVLKQPLGYSDSHIYAKLLNNKIFNSINKAKLNEPSLEKKLKAFITENKEKTFSFDLLKGEYLDEFLNYISEISQECAQREIFQIKVV